MNEWKKIDFGDIYLGALKEARDDMLLITFLELPKAIRNLIIEALNKRNSSLRNAYEHGVFGSISWGYREEVETFECELKIENYLLSISKNSDMGALIFINSKALLDIQEQFELIDEFYRDI